MAVVVDAYSYPHLVHLYVYLALISYEWQRDIGGRSDRRRLAVLALTPNSRKLTAKATLSTQTF